MARPIRSEAQCFEGRIRAVALMRFLARRVGANNPHQFATLFDQLAGTDTKASGKWRLAFCGERPLSAQQLRLLSRLGTDVVDIHSFGPADLWLALWGEVGTLWSLCRTRISDIGPMLDDRTWSKVASEHVTEKTYGAALRTFEAELLLADAYREPLSLHHLTEAIAFYRLHQFMSGIAPLDINSGGLYRCVHICLDDISVQGELDLLGVADLLTNHFARMELERIKGDKYYRDAVVVDDIATYIQNPRALVSDDSRWDALALAWVD